jgi:hypothetical protein
VAVASAAGAPAVELAAEAPLVVAGPGLALLAFGALAADAAAEPALAPPGAPGLAAVELVPAAEPVLAPSASAGPGAVAGWALAVSAFAGFVFAGLGLAGRGFAVRGGTGSSGRRMRTLPVGSVVGHRSAGLGWLVLAGRLD